MTRVGTVSIYKSARYALRLWEALCVVTAPVTFEDTASDAEAQTEGLSQRAWHHGPPARVRAVLCGRVDSGSPPMEVSCAELRQTKVESHQQ